MGLFSALMGVIRSWQCLNKSCGCEFQAWEANPACPDCGCVRVNWIPGGGHCAGTAKAADADLRLLADNYGLTDLNSAEEGRAAKKVRLGPEPDRHAQPMTFAQGFSAAVDPVRARHAGNQSGAQCLPSSAGLTHKVKAGVGNRLSASRSVPGAQANTRIEARHTGRAS